MLYSSSMYFVLVFPLTLAILSSGHSYILALDTSDLCHEKCPPGYHTNGECNDPSNAGAKYKCVKCQVGSFTEIENSIEKCQRCHTCSNYEVEIKPCTLTKNTECGCKEEYYNGDTQFGLVCKLCTYTQDTLILNNSDYIKKCKPCNRANYMNSPHCQKTTTTVPPTVPAFTSTVISTKSINMTSTSTRPIPSKTQNPSVAEIPVHGNNTWIVWLVVLLTVVFGFLLLKSLFEKPGNCPCWSRQKDVEQHTEDPTFSEQRSHQGLASTTLTLHISEETPIMCLSQSPFSPEHSAHSALLPNTELKAARQDEQTKDWPAVVLYAIIKEVPLRRWKEFLRLLSVADEQLERAELEVGLGLGSMERQYQMLRLWSQRASASLDDVYSALHYMELTRCAQLLQENLEKLQWRAETKQGQCNTPKAVPGEVS